MIQWWWTTFCLNTKILRVGYVPCVMSTCDEYGLAEPYSSNNLSTFWRSLKNVNKTVELGSTSGFKLASSDLETIEAISCSYRLSKSPSVAVTTTSPTFNSISYPWDAN